MAPASPRQSGTAEPPEILPYAEASRRPLAIVAFLLPAIAFYEYAAVAVLAEHRDGSTLSSRDLIHTLFSLFGVIGVHLPAVLLLATLAAQHLLAKHPWRLKPGTLGVMLGEAAMWSLPIVVLAGILGSFPLDAPGSAPPKLEAAAIAVGAGVYEEFVFRFALIAAVHGVLVDLCGARESVGRWLGLGASVFAFTAYHGVEVGGVIDLNAVIFFGLSGLFLGWLFLARGLGIAAGAHAIYDLLVLVAVPALRSG